MSVVRGVIHYYSEGITLISLRGGVPDPPQASSRQMLRMGRAPSLYGQLKTPLCLRRDANY